MRELRLIALLLLLVGCSREEEEAYVPSPDTSEAIALRDSISKAVQGTKKLVLFERAYIPDGGSILFFFKTDVGKAFELLALHHNPGMGGSPKYQVFRVHSYEAKAEFDLLHGSSLESQLIALLEKCELSERTDPKSDWEKVTPETRNWLVTRLKDRSITWKSCP